MSQLDATTESDESTSADIAPSSFNNDNIDVSGIPAVVTWLQHDGGIDTRQHLSHSPHDHLTLQIHRDTSTNNAFFQLKANVALKARRDRTNVFLSIQPERIQTVAIVEEDAGKDLGIEKLASSTLCLKFVLSRPPSLVVPKGDLTPKHRSSRSVLDALQALAKQTRFSVDMPSATMSKTRLMTMCQAVSYGNVQSTSKFMDVASLYGGKGGRVIEHDATAIFAAGPAPDYAECEEARPPSYEKLSSSSPPQPQAAQKSGMKRRRASSGSNSATSPRSQKVAHANIEGLCMKMMERIEDGFNKLGSRLDRMEKRLVDLESCVDRHAQTLGVSIERVHDRSSEQVGELRDELDRGLDDVKKETEDIIAMRVEDEMYVVREQLEDCVKDEMANVEERLEDKLQESITSANVSLEFNWNR